MLEDQMQKDLKKVTLKKNNKWKYNINTASAITEILGKNYSNDTTDRNNFDRKNK